MEEIFYGYNFYARLVYPYTRENNEVLSEAQDK